MRASDADPRWQGGADTAIAWPGGIALVSAALPIAAAERIWSRMHRDPQLGTFLKALAECTGTGFLDLPPFAIAVLDGPKCHVAVRGEVTIDVLLTSQSETLNGAGITTWAERVFVEPLAVRLSRPDAAEDAPEGPLVDGVVPACAITLGEFAGPAREAAAIAQAGASAQAAEAAPPEHRPLSAAQPPPVEAPAPEPKEVAAPVLPAALQETLAEEDEEPEVRAVQPPAAAAGPEPVVEAQESGPNPYQSLWDESEAVDVEAAAVREVAEGSPQPGRAGPAALDEQLSGATVMDEGQAEVVMDGPTGQSVLARFCDRGHANPPERGDCFACGSPITGDARLAARPQLGWIRVEGGETVPLRGPVIAGRNPSTAALKSQEPARLLALPHAHVSSNHLAFLIEGWRVMVRDLGSSNGTYLRRHGKPPVRLPEEGFPLVPGDLIDLGKGVFIHLDRIP